MKITVAVLSLSAALFSHGVQARQTPSLGLVEKVASSDAIVVGTVVSVHSPVQASDGVKRYAVLKVEEVVKGARVPSTISFVVKGFSAELDPRCCVLNSRYLLFLKSGFDVFSMEMENVRLVRKGVGEYYSGVNGPYSAYVIKGKEVIAWTLRGRDPLSEAKDSVLAEIERAKGNKVQD